MMFISRCRWIPYLLIETFSQRFICLFIGSISNNVRQFCGHIRNCRERLQRARIYISDLPCCLAFCLIDVFIYPTDYPICHITDHPSCPDCNISGCYDFPNCRACNFSIHSISANGTVQILSDRCVRENKVNKVTQLKILICQKIRRRGKGVINHTAFSFVHIVRDSIEHTLKDIFIRLIFKHSPQLLPVTDQICSTHRKNIRR